MELDVEVVLAGDSSGKKHRLKSGVYVITSAENSQHGHPIQVQNQFVRRDHAIIASSGAGWRLTPTQPEVWTSGRVRAELPINVDKKIALDSKISIGDVTFSFTQANRELGEDGPEVVADFESLSSVEARVHLQLSKNMQLISRIEKADSETDDYKTEALSSLRELAARAVEQYPEAQIFDHAGEAAQRLAIHEVLGSNPGEFAQDIAKLSGIRTAEIESLQKRMYKALDITPGSKDIGGNLAKINEDYIPLFRQKSKSFGVGLLKGLVTSAIMTSVNDVVFGIGPLERLQDNEEVSEIMVVCHDKIFVELGGNLLETGLRFASEKSSRTIVEHIVGRVGKQINIQNPYEDARLKDGSRVNAVIAPVAIDGAALTVRKFSSSPLTLEDLIRFGCLNDAMASFLAACVLSKQNIIVSGGTGTGKTTMINWLGTMIPEDERLVTVEDVAELQLPLPHVVRLEARPASSEGDGAITIRDLVKNSLRMRPDRILIGECRGGEAFDMLQAMNTGHEGSLTTLHANTAEEAISRLENLILMADQGLPIESISYQIASAIDIVLQLKRYANGARKILEIAEVGGVDPVTGRVEVNPIFATEYDHNDPDAKATFRFAGRTPEKIGLLIKAGFDPSLLSF